MRKLAGLLVASLVLLSSSLVLAEHPAISFDTANPPFMYSRDGTPAGLYPALISAAFDAMGVKVTLQARPWARVIPELDKGLAGAAGLYKTAERERKYDYSDPIYVEKLMVFYHQSRPVRFAGVDDFRGLRIGVIRGWSYAENFDQARKRQFFVLEESISDEQNFRKLALGRVDAVLAVAEAGTAMMKQFDNIAVAEVPLAQNPTYLAFAKSAQQTVLLREFNQVLKTMKTRGEYQKILASELPQ